MQRHSTSATLDPEVPAVPDRLRFQRRLLDDFLSEGQEDVEKGGLAAVITAGPPGAGKSTLLRKLELAGPGWRIIDADAIKLKLLDAAVQDGIFDSVFAQHLEDGYPIMPNEVSSLVNIPPRHLTTGKTLRRDGQSPQKTISAARQRAK